MKAYIKIIQIFLPEMILSNDALALIPGYWDANKIYEKTGIWRRHIVQKGECASDLAFYAAQKIFQKDLVAPTEIDFLLLCTQSPDYILPATACVLQDRLGLRKSCGALDFNQGCSGFVYGLALAKSLIETGSATNVLLLTAETYSKYINPRDRSARTIFGDGAAATLISGSEEADNNFIGPFVFGTDGCGAQNLIVPAGGMRLHESIGTAQETEDEDGNWRSPQNLYMNGPEIFNFTLKAVPDAVQQLLQKTGQSLANIDFFVFHQANKFMLEKLRIKLKIPEEKFWLNIVEVGNTVSSTIPIALHEASNQHCIKKGDKIMLVGFGVGYSWAATIIQMR